MEYNPVTCVWETTMGCNMRCGHCGSSCKEPLPGELSTEESLRLIEMLREMDLQWVTLSGGEPLTRKDLPLLVKSLSDKGIQANIITNGWLLSDDIAKKLKDSNVSTVAISIDGTEKIHDKIRRPGAFMRAKKSFETLKKYDLYTACVTTISNENIGILKDLKEELIKWGVKCWQLQIGLPMGNFSEHPDWVIYPDQVDEIIDFCYDTSVEGKIKICAADCLGYYDKKLIEVSKAFYDTSSLPVWKGCSAGVRSFGILHNGDVVSCTSIRDKNFAAGNIRERSLKEIWEDPKSFSWRRNLKKDMLSGECKTCRYGDECLGGCTNTRLVMYEDIYSENNYCIFNYRIKRLREKLSYMDDVKQLYERAYAMAEDKRYQESSIILDRVLELSPDDVNAIKLKGFTEFMCGNYDISEELNRKVLCKNKDDYYAIQGLGLALKMQEKIPESIALLERAARLTQYKNEDVLNDLRFIYANQD